MTRLNYLLLTGLMLTGIYSCTKTADDFDAQGGLLPSHYVDIRDSSFSPAILTIANGSSVTFTNRTAVNQTIISEDSSTIVSPDIAAGSFYFVKPDTLAGSLDVRIYYHSKAHPAVVGTIILTP
jgi:plastocyanin